MLDQVQDAEKGVSYVNIDLSAWVFPLLNLRLLDA